MGNRRKLLGVAGFVIVLAAVLGFLVRGHTVAVLNPAGPIAHQERGLIKTGVLLSLIVVLPVFGLTFFIAWRYREQNKTAKYSPDWDGSHIAETIWWLVPSVLIGIIAVITWQSSHQLDPFRPISKPINSTTKPVTIQVVALDWKWLFIYPEQYIASVNLVEFPAGTPVNFQVTADAPMNSFWIPRLGGQIYAMSGMSTQLHLLADHTGDYRGSSANISGKGFASMHFIARATTQAGFDRWVKTVQQSTQRLDMRAYDGLAKPSQAVTQTSYSHPDGQLYSNILMKYMMPGLHLGSNQAAAGRVSP